MGNQDKCDCTYIYRYAHIEGDTQVYMDTHLYIINFWNFEHLQCHVFQLAISQGNSETSLQLLCISSGDSEPRSLASGFQPVFDEPLKMETETLTRLGRESKKHLHRWGSTRPGRHQTDQLKHFQRLVPEYTEGNWGELRG